MSFQTFITKTLTIVLACTFSCANAADEKKPKPKQPKIQFFDKMDFGPFLADTITAQKDNIAIKGVAISLGADGKGGGQCFDMDLLRMSAGWTGGYLKLTGDAYDRQHNQGPMIVHNILYSTNPTPGWSKNATFDDPRSEPFGPLPHDWARFKGIYRHGSHVVLHYTVGNGDVLELPGMSDDTTTLTRTLSVTNLPASQMIIAELANSTGSAKGDITSLTAGDKSLSVRLIDAPQGVSIQSDGARLVLHTPSLEKATFTLALAAGSSAATQLQSSKPGINPTTLIKGGPARWNDTLTTSGTLGKNDSAYAVDTITTPDDNPWFSNLRFAGLDFFDNGRAALSTWNGDVWIVSGLDDKLSKITWRRYAAGLHQPLGLKIVDNIIYTLCRNGLWRLHDLNSDGEADYYEMFNGDIHSTPAFHEFAFDLHTDAEGNFYHTKSGPVKKGGRGWETIAEHHGSIIKISKDGKTLERYATGVRAPNGMGIGPTGVMTSGDNEGTWMPTCRINYIKSGSFLGVMDLHHREMPPTIYDPPICFISHKVDNSSGAQVWATDKRWGPLAGNLLHLSYGKSSLFAVAWGMAGDIPQGGVSLLPLKFNTGIMRARVNPKDGQVYVAGLKGWQTTAARDGGFQRIRATGKSICVPITMQVKSNAIELSFSDTLDPQLAVDLENWAAEQWDYLWTANYGSPEVKPGTKEPGHAPMELTGITLLPDGKTLRLAIKDLKPVMQFNLKYRIATANGDRVNGEFMGTINTVPK